ncbi:MAG TPA: hypothetical protein PLN79_14785 [bacterium]|nr:hypothetical protein [Anaerolineales bacterium]HNC88240.1 hypothetical protein [Anaerolineales bacterium]HND78551.1 hypothetical protein [bacterium]
MFGLNAHEINSIVFTSLTSALITGVIVYLIQKSIENSFNKKMEEFRASIQYTFFEQQTKFTRTFQKKIETFEVLHQKLNLLGQSMNSLANLIKNEITASSQKKSEEYDKATETVSTSYLDFLHYYTENRLYLPDQSIETIEKISTKVGMLSMLIGLSGMISTAPLESVTWATSWANREIKKIDLDIKSINPKKPNVPLFIDQIIKEMKYQIEALEKHYKFTTMDDSTSISTRKF